MFPIKRTVFFTSVKVHKNTVRLIGNIEFVHFMLGQQQLLMIGCSVRVDSYLSDQLLMIIRSSFSVVFFLMVLVVLLLSFFWPDLSMYFLGWGISH